MRGPLYIVMGYIVCAVRCDTNDTAPVTPEHAKDDDLVSELPVKITAEEAMTILENNKEKHPMESVALIKDLKWLMSELNVTELTVHNQTEQSVQSVQYAQSAQSVQSTQSTQSTLSTQSTQSEQHNVPASTAAGTELRENSPKIIINYNLDKGDGYYFVKRAILSHSSFTSTVPVKTIVQKSWEDSLKYGYQFRQSFLAKLPPGILET